MLSNLKFAVRQLAKSPGFAAVALITLALGIGACTAMFSIANAVLFRPLPFKDPERLVWIENVGQAGMSARTTRADTFKAWREENTSFEAVAGYFAFYDFGRRQTLDRGRRAGTAAQRRRVRQFPGRPRHGAGARAELHRGGVP